MKYILLSASILLGLFLYVLSYWMFAIDGNKRIGGGRTWFSSRGVSPPRFSYSGPGYKLMGFKCDIEGDIKNRKIKLQFIASGYGKAWIYAAYIYAYVSGEYTYEWSDDKIKRVYGIRG